MNAQPLISAHGLDDVFAWRAQGPVRVREFLADAHALAACLPAGDWLLNMCEDRYHFAVGFAAGLLAGKVSLQPSSQSPETLHRLAADYPGVSWLGDRPDTVPGLPGTVFPDPGTLPRPVVSDMPCVDAERVVAILFTSGSTGLPQPHRKTWGRLVLNGRAESTALGLMRRPHSIVGTVPVQHSYGFESTFLLALHGACQFTSGKPFYPQDIVAALEAVPRPRMLVTTPFHLSALLASGLPLPPMDLVLSATAPLSPDLARRAEERCGAPVHEIYGSTESSALATRRTLDGAAWHLMQAVQLEHEDDTTYASGGHVEGRVPLADIIESVEGGHFLLHGRHADLVNIAGKRTSLAYLNHQIGAVPGVVDAAFFLPDEAGDDGVTRLTAFVVAPTRDARTLMADLRQRLDAIFLPRPLVFMEALPRNTTGKLTRQALEALYAEKVGPHGRG
ncbi:acyl-coenzyme A synthetase/AMP-(fatty) acid ligase [Hydrogenophaga laconesensis]|uniref:Long-chain-fatty-acid--CoA ligase n=1 Tax=Hydrogenophaga laconesensis TaxID=1805971 RepID=A0ABU1V7W7_9BURK|nr:acyl-coenzyme A synthetase/AMP-(fatty) acid ligase [Hydrogenophaga laconesensis]